ncbi:MAG: PD-(D/E)XK nuclease family protein [Chitinophagaceae bacterium]
MEIEKYQSILEKVYQISNSYYEQAKASGERFNIFEILGMESKENKTHSAFLYALLNPKGNHLQESIFLQLFLKEIDCENFIEIDSAFITLEKHIGLVDNNYENGGRIDLVIEDKKGNALLIENKIYAPDQAKQLKRYYNYGEVNHKNKFKLIYLTLWGDSPTTYTTGDLLEEQVNSIIKLSYKKDITNWLEKCATLVKKIPATSEAILQYQRLIQIITETSNKSKMTQEITALVTQNEDNFIAAFKIQETLRNVYISICQKVKDTIDDYNKRFAKKVKYKNNYIEFFVAYDNSDGYFISFRIINIDNQYVDSLNDEFKNLFNILYNLNKGFNHNSQYLGYINHHSLSFFDRLEPEIIFKLDNYEYRNEFIQKIFNEGLDYCDALEYYINQNKQI